MARCLGGTARAESGARRDGLALAPEQPTTPHAPSFEPRSARGRDGAGGLGGEAASRSARHLGGDASSRRPSVARDTLLRPPIGALRGWIDKCEGRPDALISALASGRACASSAWASTPTRTPTQVRVHASARAHTHQEAGPVVDNRRLDPLAHPQYHPRPHNAVPVPFPCGLYGVHGHIPPCPGCKPVTVHARRQVPATRPHQGQQGGRRCEHRPYQRGRRRRP